MKLILKRISDNGIETNGRFTLLSDSGQVLLTGVTMELPWKNNAHKVSCIPAGKYHAEPRVSEAHGHHFHVLNVPGRDMILVHEGNYVRNFLGCIGVGVNFADIDKDGQTDITGTKATLANLVKLAPKGFDLFIQAVNVEV